MPPDPLIVLDRDGVINQDSDAYIKSPQEWIPIEGSLEAIADLKRAGWQVAVATNQSGLARGLFNQAMLDAIHEKMERLLAEDHGVALDAVVWCPHGPLDGCNCRKPAPGLLLEVAARLRADASKAWVVGDSLRDLQAAAAVGARPVLVLTGKGEQTVRTGGLPPGTLIAANLRTVASNLVTGVWKA